MYSSRKKPGPRGKGCLEEETKTTRGNRHLKQEIRTSRDFSRENQNLENKRDPNERSTKGILTRELGSVFRGSQYLKSYSTSKNGIRCLYSKGEFKVINTFEERISFLNVRASRNESEPQRTMDVLKREIKSTKGFSRKKQSLENQRDSSQRK